MEKIFFSTPELAEWLGVFHTTVRRWIEQGKIKGIRVGRNYKITVDEAIRVLEDYQIPLPNVLKEHNLKQKKMAEGLSSRIHTLGSTILQKLLIVEEIEDPALVCRRESILGANRAFADLVRYSQVDLIGIDVADVTNESFRDSLIEFTRNPHEHSVKSSSGFLVDLKTEKTPNRKARITVGSLDQMKDVFLLVFKLY